MGSNSRDKSLVVVQLSGGNDYLNTVVPYGDGLYYDYRPNLHIAEDTVMPIDGRLGFNPNLKSIKRLWDDGKVAIINGIGYETPNRSHFRSMDIWHTAEPDAIGTEGWLGRTIRELDPAADNVLTAVNFGRGLPRALACRGVPVASVGNLETYGLFPDMEGDLMKRFALETLAKMYGPEAGRNAVMSFLGQTGSDALKGADILRTAPANYTSTIEYGGSPIAQGLKNAAQVMFADFGTRVYYTQQGSYDTHSGQLASHATLLQDMDGAVGDFWDDVKEHGRADEAVMMIFTEFGRRIRDNGTGSDHGSGGVAFIIGDSVRGGLYGEYPSLKEEDQIEGDLRSNNDFRSTYTTLLEDWLSVEAGPTVNGQFDKIDFIKG